MTEVAVSRRSRPADRWPTAMAVVAFAGVAAVIVALDREVELFGPIVVTMAAIYLNPREMHQTGEFSQVA